jgi:hypothetical protein
MGRERTRERCISCAMALAAVGVAAALMIRFPDNSVLAQSQRSVRCFCPTAS